jgi:PAS domain S-box-containing protein
MSAGDRPEGSGTPPKGSEQADATGLFDLLVEQVIDYAIFALDADGKVATWNAGAQRIKGYAPDEVIGKPYCVFFTDEDRTAGKPQQILARVRETGRFEEEAWRVRKDGQRFWASVVVTALRDRQGGLRGYAKITRDLSERLKSEEEARRAAADRAARRQAELDEQEVRRSRDELDLILKSITEGVTVLAADGRLAFANDAAARLCGYASAEEMIAAPREDLLDRFEMRHEDGTPFPPAELPGRLALEGTASKAIVRFRTKATGDERWSMVSAAPVRDAAGRIELAVNVFQEFTEIRRAEQAWHFLAEASATLGSSLDYEATLKQVTRLAVPEFADWCGVEILTASGELRQLAVAHVDPAKLALATEWRRRWPPRPDSALFRVLRTGIPEVIREVTDQMVEALMTDPAQKQVAREIGIRSVIIVPLRIGPEPFGALSFIAAESGRRYGSQDLILATEIGRRASLAVENARAYAEARAAVQVRDNFLSIASHELRTPLSALTILMTSLVRAANQGRLMQLGAEGLKDRMLKGERQTKQLTRLVDRLLDVSRLSSTDMQLEPGEMDLAEVVRDAISRLEDAAADEGIHIDLEAAGLSIGRWDRSRIDQVVTNLLANAIKYAPNSRVVVSVAPASPGFIRLAVKDDGPGVPLDAQERIFNQFERAVSSHSPGMGLGLWIVRRVVEAHGGTVTLDSAPGRGACFTVTLPLEAPSLPQMPGAANPRLPISPAARAAHQPAEG